MTKYRQKILQIIQTAPCHLTAEEIFSQLRLSFPKVVLATVYNTLNRLWQDGQIRKLSVEGMPDRYDRATRHDHLVCQGCGKLVDIQLPDLTDSLQAQAGRPILAYDLKLFYLCDACRKERNRQKKGGEKP